PTFKLVTKGFDWGPGYWKIIIDLKSEVNDLSNTDFKVEAKKNYEAYEPSSKEVKTEVGNEEVGVLEYYLSDVKGNKLQASYQNKTLELSVHSDNIFTNPFKYNFETGLNNYEPIEYKVTMSQPINNLTGEKIEGFVLKPPDCTEVLEPEARSEEHTSELQSRFDLVCRLRLEKKNKETKTHNTHT